jgi:hypothetical protein
VWAELPPVSQALLAVARCVWRADAGERDGVLADLTFAAAAANEGIGDPWLVGRARLDVRALVERYATHVDDELLATLPGWAIVPFDSQLVEMVNTWSSLADWAAKEDHVRAEWATLSTPDTRNALAVLTQLYPEHDQLRLLDDIVTDAAARGLDPALADQRDHHHLVNMIQEWVNASTWTASQRFLTEHLALLTAPAADEYLRTLDGDPVIHRHRAILHLARVVPVHEVYDAILEPADARALLIRLEEEGDQAALRALVGINPESGVS